MKIDFFIPFCVVFKFIYIILALFVTVRIDQGNVLSLVLLGIALDCEFD